MLEPGALFVLADRLSRLLYARPGACDRSRARTRRRLGVLLAVAGFGEIEWRRLYAGVGGAALATNEGGARQPPGASRRLLPPV